MFLCDLLVKWSESFEIFKKKELKLFSLLILNSFRRSLHFLIKKCWWIFIPLLVFFDGNIFSFVNKLFFEPSLFKAFVGVRSFYSFLFLLSVLFLCFVSFLIVRPSVEAKDFFYVVIYLNRFLGFVLLSFFTSGFSILPFFWIMVLFFLDSGNIVKSLFLAVLNGIKFTIYYLPIMVIFGIIKVVLNYLLIKFGLLILSLMNQGAFVYILWSKIFCLLIYILWLLFLCVMSIYYVRMKHKDFNLFYY